MFEIGSVLDNQIKSTLKNRPVVLFIEPEDPRILEAAFELPKFAKPVFLASREAVEKTIARELPKVDRLKVEFLLGESAFCPVGSRPDLQAEFAKAVLAAPPARRIAADAESAARFVATTSGFGIMAVTLGHADIVVGGARHNPKDYFRPLVKALSDQSVPCEVGVIVLPDDHPDNIYPHNIVVLGDIGVNAVVTPEILANIAVGTCAVARDLIPEDLLPVINGAMVSYSNRGADEGPSPELVRQAAALVPGLLEKRIARGERYRSISIVSEIKISVALSARSAHMYQNEDGQEDDFRGNNVIITPNLDTGNLLFHLFSTLYPEARKFVCVFGLRFRGVDLPMDVQPVDAALAVKANILRLVRSGQWQRTEKDTFFPRPRILAINPGSTSTKIAIFRGEEEVISQELQHGSDELAPFEGKRVSVQFAFRKTTIEAFLAANSLSMADIDAVSARGGVLKPLPHGTYTVNQAMLDDLLDENGSDHASNLGALIADALTKGTDKPAYITDPIVVDEMLDRARTTGLKELPRRAISHALNQIATAHRFAREEGTFYEHLNLIVCHMGGGISIGAHKHGRIVDVNNALDGEGPMTPQRSGSLPVAALIRLCYSGKYTLEEMLKLNKGRGGLIDLVGTADFRLVEKEAMEGNPEYLRAFDAISYQISKWICSAVPAFDGEDIDRILLTGGLARSRLLVETIRKAVSPKLCGISVYPGENEMMALAQGALRVLSGKEPAKEYAPGA